MALPQHVLDRLPAALLHGGSLALAEAPKTGLSLGLGALDGLLPDGGLLRGGVVELCVTGAAAGATRIALAACRAAQAEGRERGGATPWCAFVDPSGSLHGPGVAEAGVVLERLLVVRPPLEALARVSTRVAESRAFALVVIDTMGAPGRPVQVPLGTWPRIVRRLAMAVEGTAASVLLVTDSQASRPLPLPVAQRIELSRPGEQELRVRMAKDKHGRINDFVSFSFFAPRTTAMSRDSSARSKQPAPAPAGVHAHVSFADRDLVFPRPNVSFQTRPPAEGFSLRRRPR